ncbi:hypothetical protein Tco_1336624 [Tanacetum coccineum]
MNKEYLTEFRYSAKALENSKVYFSTPISGIYGEVGVNTFRNAIDAHYLPHFSEYVAPPSIDIVRPWFKKIRYPEAVPAKGTLKKSLLPSRWKLLMAQIIYKEATKGGSSKAPTGSKTGHSKKRKVSSSAMDTNPSQPLVSTPVDTGIHKDDLQATGGPTSLGVTSEKKPTLNSVVSASGNDALAVSTTKADPGNSAPSDFVPQQQVEEEVADSPEDDPVIVVDDSDEDEKDEIYPTLGLPKFKSLPTKSSFSSLKSIKWNFKKSKAEVEAALLKSQPSFPNLEQLNTLLVKSLKTEFSNILYAHDFSSSLPTELKDLPSKFNELNKKVKGLKKQVHELEIELLGDLKEIPTKLKDFTKIVASVQAKLKTLDALPDHSVPLVGQTDTKPTEGEKNTNQATIS